MNCIIVDDEPIARRGMKRLVETDGRLEVKALLRSAEEAQEFLASNETDLIFLDIQMPGLTGIDFARTIGPETLIIFTTAYSEYAADSYEVSAIDYLLKPIEAPRFARAVSKAIDYKRLLAGAVTDSADGASATDTHLIAKADRRYHRIAYDDILYIEGLKDYVILHLPDRRIVTRMTIKRILEILPVDRFLRVSKSNIVNLKAVESFDNNDIFIGTAEIAISPNLRDSVLSRLLGNSSIE